MANYLNGDKSLLGTQSIISVALVYFLLAETYIICADFDIIHTQTNELISKKIVNIVNQVILE